MKTTNLVNPLKSYYPCDNISLINGKTVWKSDIEREHPCLCCNKKQCEKRIEAYYK